MTSKRLLSTASILVLALCGAGTPALAGPTGADVVAGQATISVDGSTTTITQLSQRAVIEWQDFSIDAGELARFLQNNADSAVLNKVISSLPSHILGELQANGKVFLVNPNGIVIGAGAQINAAEFIASTLNVATQSFMDGGDLTFSGDSTSAIINLGEVHAGQGDVFLIARQVRNEGRISAPQGEAGLIAGGEVYLSTERTGGSGSRVSVKASELAVELREKLKGKTGIDNQGIIEAARASLLAQDADLYDLAVNNRGVIRTRGLSMGPDGTIRLFASGRGGSVRHSGFITARTYDGSGGRVEVLGDHIALKSGSSINASAVPLPGYKPDFSGGTVLIGGDYQGGGDIQTARTTVMEEGASISADGAGTGGGGTVILWSDEETAFSGTISATSGTEGGDGGFVETSGKDTLKVGENARVDTRALNSSGESGAWLLDPTDVSITDAAGGGDIIDTTISANLDTNGSVTITTSGSGADDGDITVSNATIQYSGAGSQADLTLKAHNTIDIYNSAIESTNGGGLNVTLNADSDGSGAGAISLTGSTITTEGGDFVAGGGADPLTAAAYAPAGRDAGVGLWDSGITTGAGNITLTGHGHDDSGAAGARFGIRVNGRSALSTTSGEITLTGTAGAGDRYNIGVIISGMNDGETTLPENETMITSETGAISITGQGAGTADLNHGVKINNDAVIRSTGTGADAATITVNGTAGAGAGLGNAGVDISGSGTIFTSAYGDIFITGQGNSDGDSGSYQNRGVALHAATLSSTGTGANAATITLDGTGGPGGSFQNDGVFISSGLLTSVDGDLSITGRAGGTGSASYQNAGINIQNSSLVSSGTGENAATITLDGTGGTGTHHHYGVHLSSGTNVTSADGNISITGQGGGDGTGNRNYGIFVASAAVVESTGTNADAAKIILDGTGGDGEDINHGVYLAKGSMASAYGDISITGQGGSNGVATSNSNLGFNADGGTISSTGTGADAAKITIDGTGGAGNNYNIGIQLNGADVSSVDGDISFIGQGGSRGGAGSQTAGGIYLIRGASVSSTGTGADAAAITLHGTGGAGDTDNRGVYIAGMNDGATTTAAEETQITSVDGTIAITGRGGGIPDGSGRYGRGVFITNEAVIKSTGAGGDITIHGTGSNTTGQTGLFITDTDTLIETGAADINLTGIGGSGSPSDTSGLALSGASVLSDSGAITLYGESGGPGGDGGTSFNNPVSINGTVQTTSAVSGKGKITIIGNGLTDDTLNSRGVIVQGDILTNAGDILIKGQSETSLSIGTWQHPTIQSTGGGTITFDVSSDDPAASQRLNFNVNDVYTQTIGGAGTSAITIIADEVTYASTALLTVDFQTSGDITILTATEGQDISLGDSAGTAGLNIAQEFLDFFNPGGRLIIGDSTGASGVTTVSGLDMFTNDYDIYGGTIYADSLTNVDGSTSTLNALAGDLYYTEDDVEDGVGAGILDEVKAYFTAARDLILRPEDPADNIKINGGGGTGGLFEFEAADLAGFTGAGRNLVIGDPVAGTGTVNISALDMSGTATYGIGFAGDIINVSGDITSGHNLSLTADTVNFSNYSLTAARDLTVAPMTDSRDMSINGGGVGLIVSAAALANLTADSDGNGSGDLIFGDEEAGTGTLLVYTGGALDLSAETYGLAFYGRKLTTDGNILSGADLTVRADDLDIGAYTLSAKENVSVSPNALDGADTITLDEEAGTLNFGGFTGTTVNLSQLVHDSDTNGSGMLVVGDAGSGDFLWRSDDFDMNVIQAHTGGDLTLETVTANPARNWGLGDGTGGDAGFAFTTAQLEAVSIGGALVLGDAAGTGTIGIADLSGASLGYGLRATGGSIDIGGWNAGGEDVTLTARTGDITTSGGLISGGAFVLSAAGDIATAGAHLNTSATSLTYTTGGDLYLDTNAALDLLSGYQTGTGEIEITAGGGDLDVSGALSSTATGASSLTLRAAETIEFSGGADVTIAGGGSLDVILNADSDADRSGAIVLPDITISTGGGDVTMGGGADPATEAAWGMDGHGKGIRLDGTRITTGAGNITLTGHGYDRREYGSVHGVYILGDTSLQTTTGAITVTGTGGGGKEQNHGVLIEDSGTQILSDNAITITGTGGANGFASNYNYGVRIRSSAQIGSEGSDVNITLTGTGGAGDDNNVGVYVGGSSKILSDNAITITGTGGSNGQTGSNSNYGVNISSSAQIGSTNSNAEISLTGSGGDGEDNNYGVRIYSSGTKVLSDNAITITGTGGSNGQTGSNSNLGIMINSPAQIGFEGSNAAITLTGTGGAGEDYNYGVHVTGAGTQVLSDNAITITGTGGSNGQAGSNANHGIVVNASAQVGSEGSNAAITLTGTGGAGEDTNAGVWISSDGTKILSDNAVTITGTGGSNGQAASTNNYGVIVYDGAQIGSEDSTADITLTGTGGNGSSVNFGVSLALNTNLLSDNAITITGTGGSNGRAEGYSNNGIIVQLSGGIGSEGSNAAITLTGTGGAGSHYNSGVVVHHDGTRILSDNAITITGTGGDGEHNNRGVSVSSSAQIGSEGSNAAITLTGTGGDGGRSNSGVVVYHDETRILSDNAITITGTGGSNGQAASTNNYGVVVYDGAQIGFEDSAAAITLTGTGGAGEDYNYGVYVTGAGTQVLSDHAITLNGTGGSNGQTGSDANRGVLVASSAEIGSVNSSAAIALTGVGGTGGGSNTGVWIINEGTKILSDHAITIQGRGWGTGEDNEDIWISAATVSASGNLTLIGDTFDLRTAPVLSSTGTLTLKNRTGGASIGVSGGAGDLDFSDAFLAKFTIGAGLVIGDSGGTTGAVDVDGWDLSAAGHDVEIYGSAINVGGGLDTPGALTFGTNTFTYDASAIRAARDLTFTGRRPGTLSIAGAGGLESTGGAASLSAANGIALSGALDVFGSLTVSAGGGDFETGASVSAGADIDITAKDMVIGGPISAGGDMTLLPWRAASSIGLGGAAGAFSLNDAELANLSVGGLLTIGYETSGTGALRMNSVDVSAGAYDVALYAGEIVGRRGFSADGAVSMTAYEGDVNLGGTTRAAGTGNTLVLASLNGNVSAGRLDPGAGRFLVYTGSYGQSRVPSAAVRRLGVRYGDLPPGDVTAGRDRVFYRQGAGELASEVNVMPEVDQVRRAMEAVPGMAMRVGKMVTELMRPKKPPENMPETPLEPTGPELSPVPSDSASSSSSSEDPAGAYDSSEDRPKREPPPGAREPAEPEIIVGDRPVNDEGAEGVGIPGSECTADPEQGITCTGAAQAE